MQCHEFDDRLQLLLDHRLAPSNDALLCEHAEQCRACADLLRAQTRLFQGLASSARCNAQLAGAVAFSEQTVRNHQQQSLRSRRAWRSLGWFSALSTITACGWLAFTFLPIHSQPSQVVKEDITPNTLPQATVAAPVLALSQPTATSPRGASLPSQSYGQYRQVLESLAVQIGESPQLEDVGATLQPGLRPIRSSFGLALDALRRTLPRGKDERSVRPTDGAALIPEIPGMA